MKFIRKLFGPKDSITLFPENQSDDKKLEWFKITPPWSTLDERIINAILKKYNGDPMIVVFVVTAMKQNLIPKFCELNTSEYIDSDDVLCSFISKIVYDAGSNSLKQMTLLVDNLPSNQDKFKFHYSTVMDSFESCLILDKNQVSAYSGLAMAKVIINKPDEAKKYAQQGLEVLNKVKNSVPFHLSNVDSIKNANETLDGIEESLNKIMSDANG